jgi:demethylmenaquinone methyltransferase/2-methoxy-6-polyprenyl-1,4-benzoquinol methylase
MQTDPRLELAEQFFSGTGSTYDHIVNLCTLGIDRLWKERILEKLPSPHKVMDLACGTGILTFAIAKKFPACHVIGVELREEYLELAKKKAKELGLTNVKFILSRAEDVVLDDAFDCITSSYLAKYADLKLLVRNLTRMLREDGLLLFHDFTYPTNPIWTACWEFYFKLLQRFGTRKYPQWENVFYGLPELVRGSPWVETLRHAMVENGLQKIETQYLIFKASAIMTGKKVRIASTPAVQVQGR